jgi:hypothetical protein
MGTRMKPKIQEFTEEQLTIIEQLLIDLKPSENLIKYWKQGWNSDYSQMRLDIEGILKHIETYPKTYKRYEVGDYVACIEGEEEVYGVVARSGNFGRHYIAKFGDLNNPGEYWDDKFWPEKNYRVLKKISKRKAKKAGGK